MLNDYKYAIRTVKQVGDYNKITNYLILHIRKIYKHGSNVADAIESQELFNFEPSALKLQISLTVKTKNTTPQEKLEIKPLSHEPGKAYAFLFGQCTTGLQHRIEAKAKYEAKIKGDPIRLLEAIKENSLSVARLLCNTMPVAVVGTSYHKQDLLWRSPKEKCFMMMKKSHHSWSCHGCLRVDSGEMQAMAAMWAQSTKAESGESGVWNSMSMLRIKTFNE